MESMLMIPESIGCARSLFTASWAPNASHRKQIPYTIERYRGRSFNLATGEWLDVSPRAPETVEFYLQEDARLIGAGTVYIRRV